VATSGLRGIFRYTESELDPPVHAEILIESARNEARVAILEVLIALGFAVYYGFKGDVVRGVAIFALITVLPLLLDASLRRAAAKKVMGRGPQPMRRR
jgi:hypothetical protein